MPDLQRGKVHNPAKAGIHFGDSIIDLNLLQKIVTQRGLAATTK
jgi:hypothetical protein